MLLKTINRLINQSINQALLLLLLLLSHTTTHHSDTHTTTHHSDTHTTYDKKTHITIIIATSTNDLQPSTAIANQLPGQYLHKLEIAGQIHHSIDNDQHKHCMNRRVTV